MIREYITITVNDLILTSSPYKASVLLGWYIVLGFFTSIFLILFVIWGICSIIKKGIGRKIEEEVEEKVSREIYLHNKRCRKGAKK